MRSIKRGPRVKGPIYVWLYDHYAELSAGFRKTSPSWAGLAKFFAENGILSVDGKPPTPNAVRMAWLRVEADHFRRSRRTRSEEPPAELPSPSIVPASSFRTVSPTPDPPSDEADNNDAPDFSKNLR